MSILIMLKCKKKKIKIKMKKIYFNKKWHYDFYFVNYFYFKVQCEDKLFIILIKNYLFIKYTISILITFK